MDIFDILLDILLKPPQPFIGLFFLLFSGKIPTFSYFLIKIPTFSYFLGGLSLHLNHLYSIAHDNLQLAIWDPSFWTFLVKFGHKGP